MGKRSSRQFLIGAAVLSASLLLGGCGGDGGDGKSSDNIEGAGKDKSSESASPGASASESAGQGAPDAPEFDFPKDVKVKIDADTTGDKVKDAVLRDHGYALQAIELGFAQDKPDLSIMKDYVSGDADIQLRSNIADYKKKGKSTTGTVHYYDRKASLLKGGKSSVVRYCLSQRKSFDKDIKTGKVNRNKPSPKDFISVQDRMKKAPGGTWQVVRVFSQEGASQCAE